MTLLNINSKLLGNIFSIEKFAIHDGPGIRSIIFLKGCPLRCIWCANPEGQRIEPELVLFKNKCIGCGKCIKVCSYSASTISKNNKIILNRKKCIGCGKCIKVCYPKARIFYGRYLNIQEVMNEIMKDYPFYKNTGGGVTLSGGEPLMQPQFSIQLLKVCKENKLNTAIETCGYAKNEVFIKILKYTDQVIFDIKHFNLEAHKKLTGQSNKLILKNLKTLLELDFPMVIRITVIPGFNDNKDNIKALSNYLNIYKRSTLFIELLPYHNMGIPKYKLLGRRNKMNCKDIPNMERIKRFFNEEGLSVSII